jgi:hypothetical protein
MILLAPYSFTFKGFRQGDPFSPLLFNIVVDGMACMIKRAHEVGLIEGLVPHIVNKGCACL